MPLGGQLIKRFDAFLHLFRAGAQAMGAPLLVVDEDQFALNRVLAGLGGPPGPAAVRLHLQATDSLAALLVFLLTLPERCLIGLTDPAVLPRTRQLCHVFLHGAVAVATGGPGLGAAEGAEELSDQAIALRPLVTYNEDGEVAAVLPTGARNRLQVGPGGPYKLVVGPAKGVALDREGPLHPVTLAATWSDRPFPWLQV